MDFRHSRAFLPFLSVLMLSFSCGNAPREDPRIAQIQKDLARQEEENRRLQKEMEDLRQELRSVQSQPSTQTMPSQPARPSMTLDRMKSEVAPVLAEVIRRIKEDSDTSRKGDQYGMRVEYDLNHAVYGLVQSKDRKTSYLAKVIVKYEKFLESQKESHSYGSGAQEFFFAYRGQKWVYQQRQ